MLADSHGVHVGQEVVKTRAKVTGSSQAWEESTVCCCIGVLTMVSRSVYGLTLWKICKTSWLNSPTNADESLKTSAGPLFSVLHLKENLIHAAKRMA